MTDAPPTSSNDPALPWRRRSLDLSTWAIGLRNRVDVWGGYLPARYRRPGESKVLTKPAKAKRGKETLNRAHLSAHFQGRDVGHVIGLHTTSTDDTCRFGAVEIDRHTDALPAAVTEAAALFWHAKLCSLGFRPLLIDSDGNGGFHVLVVFAEPVPAKRAYWFFRWVVRDWREQQLPNRPETFPKQPALNGKLGNWLRLVGRHHTRDHWARLWDGERWVDGDAAIDLVLACTGDDAALIPAAAGPPKPKPCRPAAPLPANAGDVVKRCADYIRRLPPAVSGEHGHDATFRAAAEIARFGLDGADAKSILQRFNDEQTSGGKWSDQELDKKLADAKAAVVAQGRFGCRLREKRNRREAPFGSALQHEARRRATQPPVVRRSTLLLAPSAAASPTLSAGNLAAFLNRPVRATQGAA